MCSGRQGIIERRARAGGAGHEYWLTPAGDALRSVISELGHWGLVHASDVRDTDLDPSYLVWGFRKRAMLDTLPDRRIVVRFEFSGVPASRTKFRILWLVLERSGADVCAKDPGFGDDLIFRRDIADFVKVYLGHVPWRDMEGKALRVEGDCALARQVPTWIRLDKIVGRDFPVVKPAA